MPQAAYPAPAAALARYRVALSCDAQAANPGLAGLLASNSLVLKVRACVRVCVWGGCSSFQEPEAKRPREPERCVRGRGLCVYVVTSRC